MRALTTFLVGLIISSGALASGSLKGHYGHYYALGGGDNNTTDIATLCGKHGVKGIYKRVDWATLEPTRGTFVSSSSWNTILSTIAGLGAPSGDIANSACKLWLFVTIRQENTVTGAIANPCPDWLTASDGSPGYAPSTRVSNREVDIASGAASVSGSPIKITTATAHSFTTGNQIFIDLVSGNTNANGLWTITVTSPTTFTLNGRNSNATRTQSGTPTGWNGKATINPGMVCKIYDSAVLARFNELQDFLGTTYDGNAGVEGLIFQETALGLNNSGANQNFDQTVAVGGNYSGTGFTTSIIGQINRCSTAFPTSRCLYFINQINGNQKGTFDVSAALSALPDNQGCYSGPDILPANSGLVNGTYQSLISHVGCRSDSAQNTTIVGTASGGPVCDSVNCAKAFKFAVQGTFGHLGKTIPLPATDGLCINSYIFWNDSAAEQRVVDPTIKANPYGVGWYGQCTCGGAAP